jgi:hypothetical protein
VKQEIRGAAPAADDYTGVGVVLSALFALAIVPHVLAGAEGLGKVPALASQPGA